ECRTVVARWGSDNDRQPERKRDGPCDLCRRRIRRSRTLASTALHAFCRRSTARRRHRLGTVYRASHRRIASWARPLRSEPAARQRVYDRAARARLGFGGASPMIRTVIVEDHALTRAGIKTALEAAGDIEVVAEAADGEAGFAQIERTHPEVAVIDIGLPGIDGIELTRRVRSRLREIRVVILTMHDIDREILAALAAGADAYVVKASDASNLITAVRVVADGGAYFDPRIAHVVLRYFGSPSPAPPADNPLTPREMEVLRLVADGVGNAEIAQRLYLGLGTV